MRLDEAGDPDYRASLCTAEIDGWAGATAHECKAILINRKREFGDEYTADLPADYLWQTNHYLLWPYFDSVELHALFLTMQEKELIDAMVRGWMLDEVPVEEYGKEVLLPGYGAITMTTEKAAQYRFGVPGETRGCLPMNKEIIQRIVDAAPMGTWRVERDEAWENVREYHLTTYADFWHRVEVNIPCVARDWRECQMIYSGRSGKKTKIADDNEKRLYIEAVGIKKNIKKQEERLDDIKAALQVSAGDNQRIITQDGEQLYSVEERFTAQKDENLAVFLLKEAGHDIEDYRKPAGLNWDLIKEAEPEIYAASRKKSERGVYFR